MRYILFICFGACLFPLLGCEPENLLDAGPQADADDINLSQFDRAIDAGMMVELSFSIYEDILEPPFYPEAPAQPHERVDPVIDWHSAIDQDLSRSNEIFCTLRENELQTELGDNGCNVHLSRIGTVELLTKEILPPDFIGNVTRELIPYFIDAFGSGYAFSNVMIVKEISACPTRLNSATIKKNEIMYGGCAYQDYGGAFIRSRAIGSMQNILGHEIGHLFIPKNSFWQMSQLIDKEGHVACNAKLYYLRKNKRYTADRRTYMTGCSTTSYERDTIVLFPVCNLMTTSKLSENFINAGGSCTRYYTESHQICRPPNQSLEPFPITGDCTE